MQADCSRDSFDRRFNFLRVIHQQGRPVLDSESNEQTSILLHYLRCLATDLIGPAGGPEGNCGFKVHHGPPGRGRKKEQQVMVSAGRYYVDGMLCENHEAFGLFAEPEEVKGNFCFVYLDVWEQFISPLDEPLIADPALEGVTTTARSRLTWRIHRAWINETLEMEQCEEYLVKNHPESRGRMRVRPVMHPGDQARDEEPAIRYAGENQLYRVEVHNRESIKWARDNASNIFLLVRAESGAVTLRDLGRDDRTSLLGGEVVELVSPHSDEHRRLHIISDVNSDTGSFTLTPPIKWPTDPNWPVGAYLRRWDHTPDNEHNGVSLINGKWIELEHGLSVQFGDEGDKDSHDYHHGDYWMIPTRSVTEAALWSEHDAEHGRRADGTRHHYAPLAILTFEQGKCTKIDLRSRSFEPMHHSK